MKVFLDFDQVKKYIELHKKIGLDFKMTITNYTTRIVSSYCDIHFIRSSQGKRMFAAYAMLKKDISTKEIPFVEKTKLQYYDTGFKENVKLSTVYNFDLKSAYATCLFINGYISEKTFNYLNTLPKLDRLAAVGMLAGRKTTYEVDKKGEIIQHENFISEYENFFFYCVKEVSERMNFISSYLGNSFLFTWVDGIYFNPDESNAKAAYKNISPMFNEMGYKTSFEILNNFSAVSFNDCWKIHFNKDGEGKTFNIPKREAQIKSRIEDYLLSKNYKQSKLKTK